MPAAAKSVPIAALYFALRFAVPAMSTGSLTLAIDSARVSGSCVIASSPELSIGFKPTRPVHCTRVWSFNVACSAYSPRSCGSVDSLSSLKVSGVSSRRFSAAPARSSVRRMAALLMFRLCSKMRGILSLGGSVDFGKASRNRTQSSEPSLAICAVISGCVSVMWSAVHAKLLSVAQLPLTSIAARLASGFVASLIEMLFAFKRSVNGLNDASPTLSSRPVFSFTQFGAVDANT